MITLKINSVFKNHFDQPEYQVDVSSYYDIEFYLKSIHPRFNNYIRQIKIGILICRCIIRTRKTSI